MAWRGSGTARSSPSRWIGSTRRSRPCSSRCRRPRRPIWRRTCSRGACASSICRARSVSATTRRDSAGIPRRCDVPERDGLRSRRNRSRSDAVGSVDLVPGLLSDGGADRALAARGGRSARGRRDRSTRNRASRAPARRRASARISRRITGASRPTAFSRTGTRRRSSRRWARPVTFVPHLVPLDRGILETIYTRVPVRHDGGRSGAGLHRRLPQCGVRADHGRSSPRDQARRAHEFLRPGLEARRRERSRSSSSPCSTTWSRARPGRPYRISTSPSGSTSARGCCERGAAADGPQAGRRAHRAGRRAGPLVASLAALASAGPLAVVHGGGREIDAETARRGVPKQAVDGLRVTDAGRRSTPWLQCSRAPSTRASWPVWSGLVCMRSA